ncbi:MAG: hypothetical protein M3Z04_23570 [Chloroflexota bacterium]|nr:hypothetical protein [Chloroflexota bacterium]
MRIAYWRGILLGSGLLVGLTACGDNAVTPTAAGSAPIAVLTATSAAGSAPTVVLTAPGAAGSAPTAVLATVTGAAGNAATATDAASSAPTAIAPTATALPATDLPTPATGGLPTATRAHQAPTATPQSEVRNPQSVRPTATNEPEDCSQSVGGVYHWMDLVNGHRPGDLKEIGAGLLGACVDDRRLALWALGSVHEPAGVALLDRYLAAHAAGDWVRDEYDLLPVARAARAYLSATQNKIDTYAVRPISIYSTVPQYDGDGQPLTAPVGHIAPGTRLTRLERVPTDRTRPDHGGDTALVFERVQPAGDNRVYFIDISQYVAADPPYFAPPAPVQP